MNMDDDEITFYLNDVSQGVAFTGVAARLNNKLITSFENTYNTNVWVFNFGSDSSFAGNETAQGNSDANEIGDFYYEPPTDYLALCTSNLPDPSIKLPADNFNTVLYTGDGNTDRTVSVGLAPDFTWIKERSASASHVLVDNVRGATKYISSDSNATETTNSNVVTSLDSDGFTLGDDGLVNTDTQTYVSWNWLGDGVDGGTLNEVGDLDSQVNVNTTTGISIVTFTGNKTLAQTIGHGLGAIPDWLFLHNVSAAGQSWRGYCIPYGTSKYKYLDRSDVWNDDGGAAGVPTSTTFKVDNSDSINGTGNTIVCYCFLSIEGFSKGGIYTGNGNADGTFVYTGFRPQWILTAGEDKWLMLDSKRDTYNVADEALYAEEPAAAITSTSIDILSNGFKTKETTGCNVDAEIYGYLAFAESPFKYSNAR